MSQSQTQPSTHGGSHDGETQRVLSALIIDAQNLKRNITQMTKDQCPISKAPRSLTEMENLQDAISHLDDVIFHLKECQ